MSTGFKISVSLFILGALAFALPQKDNNIRQPSPEECYSFISSDEYYFSPDEVASFIVREDSTIQIIDLRTPEEFLESSIPGSINIPFEKLFSEDFRGYLDQSELKNILYSNSDLVAGEAVSLLFLKGYPNNYAMKGGMNAWYEDVMNSEFTGNKITPAENRLFETRFRARKFFRQINSLPDSLKLKYLAVRKEKESELTGGCE